MKVTQISLIFSIVAISSAIAAFGQNAPVLDTDGEEVRVGESYYIVSTTGGGLTVSPSGRCPRDVVQERSNQYGRPLGFHPEDPNDGVVRVSTNLNIEFHPFPSVNPCPQSLSWTLDYSVVMRTDKVTTGGQVGNAGAFKDWFKIEQTGLGYMLVYNFTVNGATPAFTSQLGINNALGQRHLVLSSTRLTLGFYFSIIKALPASGRPFINMISKA